jgi:hypothetical protein
MEDHQLSFPKGKINKFITVYYISLHKIKLLMTKYHINCYIWFPLILMDIDIYVK